MGHDTKRQKLYAKQMGSFISRHKGTQGPETAFLEPNFRLPGIIAGQIDVFPAYG